MKSCTSCGGIWDEVTGFLDRGYPVCARCMQQELLSRIGPVENSRKAGQGSSWIRRERRWAFYARDLWSCLYCEASAPNGATLSLDHFVPVSREATPEQRAKSTAPANIVTLCVPCNSARQAVPTAVFIRRLEERGLDARAIAARVARHRKRRFEPMVISPVKPRTQHLEASMSTMDWAATVSRLLEAIYEAGAADGSSASAMTATAAAALAETIRRTGAGAVEGARAALLAREQSAATGTDVGLAVAEKLLAEAPGLLAHEDWLEEYRDQRARELALLLQSIAA